MSQVKPRVVILIAALALLSACSETSANPPQSKGAAWIANGSTACDKYLTPEFVAAVLTHPSGKSKTLSPQACAFNADDDSANISITLMNAGPKDFEAYQQYLSNPEPLAGVGDRASVSVTGIDAVKGNDRSCAIDAGGAPGSLMIRGKELGNKLGQICNLLFAL
jgi:hypothetical protein